jgi:hypothetical protein
MKNALLLFSLLLSSFAFAYGSSSVIIEPSQDEVTWLFKNNKKGKDKILRKGDQIKILFLRNNYKEDYDAKGILVDIEEAHIVMADNQKRQRKIEKSRVKKIVSYPKNGIFNNIFGGGMLLLGGGLITLALLFWALGAVATGPVLIVGLIGLLTTAMGVSYSDKGNEEIIDQPFSEDWEIVRLDAGTQHLPSINNP